MLRRKREEEDETDIPTCPAHAYDGQDDIPSRELPDEYFVAGLARQSGLQGHVMGIRGLADTSKIQ
jgi:hypothetical protein